MAFNSAYFVPSGNQSKRGVVSQYFDYKTTDTLATCDTAGYFNSVFQSLTVGDIITIMVVDSLTAPTTFSIGTLLVSSISAAGVVDCKDAVGIVTPSTNTD